MARLLRAAALLGVKPAPEGDDQAPPPTVTFREDPTIPPRDDDELHEWIALHASRRIPRTATCEDHAAPFQVVADFYFYRENDGIVLANRSGGKTDNVACLHVVNGATKPGHSTSHIGAVLKQAQRCYAYVVRSVSRPNLWHLAPRPRVGMTNWRNGSWIEILPGTDAQTQGGHPAMTAFDELEQAKRRQPYENAKAMPAVYEAPDGRRLPGQFLATSTRVSGLGLMQRALDEAEETGMRVYTWCILETAEPCDGRDGRPRCIGRECPIAAWCIGSTDQAELDAGANPEHHCEADAALGLHGRVVHADGWRPYDEIIRTYRRAGRDTWESQHLCRKPEGKALIYAPFSDANVSELADFDPDGGPLYLSGDWGFTEPACFHLAQLREGPLGFGLYVFAEFYGAQTSEQDWARQLVEYVTRLEGYDGPGLAEWENVWARRQDWPQLPDVWPTTGGVDPSAVQLRRALRNVGIGVRAPKYTRHEVVAGQDVLRSIVLSGGGRRLFLHPRCSKTIEAFRNYRAKERDDGSFDAKPDPDPANHRYSHPVDALRYLAWVLRRRFGIVVESADEGGTDDE